MSDLSTLLGGAGNGSESDTSTQKPQRSMPKPDNVKHMEQVTGNTYNWDDGQKQWVDQSGKSFGNVYGTTAKTKGTQQKTASRDETPKGGLSRVDEQSNTEKAQAALKGGKNKDALKWATESYLSGDYNGSYDVVQQLAKDPEIANNEAFKRLAAHLKIEMGM